MQSLQPNVLPTVIHFHPQAQLRMMFSPTLMDIPGLVVWDLLTHAHPYITGQSARYSLPLLAFCLTLICYGHSTKAWQLMLGDQYLYTYLTFLSLR